MAYHGVLIPEAIAAMNIDSLNRSAVSSASSLDNGFVVLLTTKSGSTSGSGVEVFNATAPATGSLAGLWMVYSGDEIPVTDSKYKGLDPDPRSFFVAQNKVTSVFKPRVGDIILVTAEAFTGTVPTSVGSSSMYANAVNGKYQLTWGDTSLITGDCCFKLTAIKYISLADGSIGSQRVTAYELECISN